MKEKTSRPEACFKNLIQNVNIKCLRSNTEAARLLGQIECLRIEGFDGLITALTV